LIIVSIYGPSIHIFGKCVNKHTEMVLTSKGIELPLISFF